MRRGSGEAGVTRCKLRAPFRVVLGCPRTTLPMAVAIGLILLSGCATTQSPQVIRVPVAAPCLEKMPESPEFLTDAAMAKMDDGTLVIELRADQLNQRQHIAELRATLTACVR